MTARAKRGTRRGQRGGARRGGVDISRITTGVQLEERDLDESLMPRRRLEWGPATELRPKTTRRNVALRGVSESSAKVDGAGVWNEHLTPAKACRSRDHLFGRDSRIATNTHATRKHQTKTKMTGHRSAKFGDDAMGSLLAPQSAQQWFETLLRATVHALSKLVSANGRRGHQPMASVNLLKSVATVALLATCVRLLWSVVPPPFPKTETKIGTEETVTTTQLEMETMQPKQQSKSWLFSGSQTVIEENGSGEGNNAIEFENQKWAWYRSDATKPWTQMKVSGFQKNAKRVELRYPSCWFPPCYELVSLTTDSELLSFSQSEPEEKQQKSEETKDLQNEKWRQNEWKEKRESSVRQREAAPSHEMAEVRHRLASMEGSLDGLTTAMDSLTSKLSFMSSQIQRQKNQMDSAIETAQNAADTSQKAAADVSRMNSEMWAVRHSVDALQTAAVGSANDNQQAVVDSRELAESRLKLGQMEEVLRNLRQNSSELLQQIGSLRHGFSAVTQSVAVNSDTLKQLELKQRSLEQLIQRVEEMSRRLQGAENRRQLETASVERRLGQVPIEEALSGETQARISAFETEVSSLKQTLTNEVNTVRLQMAEMQSAIDSTETSRQKLEASVTQKVESVSALANSKATEMAAEIERVKVNQSQKMGSLQRERERIYDALESELELEPQLDWSTRVVFHSEVMTDSPWTRGVQWLTGNFRQNVLRPVTRAGDCLPLKGNSGEIVLKLAKAITVTSVALEHIRADLTTNTKSAPRHFAVYGLREDQWAAAGGAAVSSALWMPLADCEFQYPAEFRSKCAVANSDNNAAIDHVKFKVLSNLGAHWTCVYRIQVHGLEAAADVY